MSTIYISKICSYKEVCKILLKEYGPNTLNTFQISRHCTQKKLYGATFSQLSFIFFLPAMHCPPAYEYPKFSEQYGQLQLLVGHHSI